MMSEITDDYQKRLCDLQEDLQAKLAALVEAHARGEHVAALVEAHARGEHEAGPGT